MLPDFTRNCWQRRCIWAACLDQLGVPRTTLLVTALAIVGLARVLGAQAPETSPTLATASGIRSSSWTSYRWMTDDELHALWLYLRSVPANAAAH